MDERIVSANVAVAIPHLAINVGAQATLIWYAPLAMVLAAVTVTLRKSVPNAMEPNSENNNAKTNTTMKNAILLFFVITTCLTSCQFFGGGSPSLELIPYRSGDKWGYLDNEGKIVINPQFSQANVFMDGVALVRSSENKYGFISLDGKYLINATYKAASPFSEGLACVVPEDGKPQFIDEKGNVKFTVNEARYCGIFSEGYAAIGVESKEGVKWGFINKEGKTVVNPQFDGVSPFKEGLAGVAKVDKEKGETLWGFIDHKGAIIIHHQFRGWSASFNDGLAMVSDGEKIGYVDSEGKYVINPQFDDAGEFRNGLAPIRQGDLCGFIDKEGKIVINPQFNAVENFSGSMAAVSSSDGKFGYVDKDGKFIINPQFQRASDFYGGIAFVQSADKWGIIDRDGKYIVNPQFDGINYNTEGYRSSIVESDYFDVSAVSRDLLEGTNAFAFRNLKGITNISQLKTVFPNLTVSNYEWSGYSNDNIVLNDHAMITNVQFTFSESPSAGQKPVYRTEQKYDYWKGGNVTKQVLDHYENIPNDNATLSTVTFNLYLTGTKAQAKAEKIFKHIIEDLKTKGSLAPSGEPNGFSNDNMSVIVTENGSRATYQILFNKGDLIITDVN